MTVYEKYADWVSAGRPLGLPFERAGLPTDPGGSVPEFVKHFHLLRNLDPRHPVFVETGTFHGTTTALAAPVARFTYTIEADRALFLVARKKFAGRSDIRVLFGDSASILPFLAVALSDQDVLFWLDAHYAGEGTTCLDQETPILDELDALSRVCSAGFAILIDDARLFGRWPAYPTLERIEQLVKDRFPFHRMTVLDDQIQILHDSSSVQ